MLEELRFESAVAGSAIIGSQPWQKARAATAARLSAVCPQDLQKTAPLTPQGSGMSNREVMG